VLPMMLLSHVEELVALKTASHCTNRFSSACISGSFAPRPPKLIRFLSTSGEDSGKTDNLGRDPP